MKWEPTASLGGVGWVFIDPIPKLVVAVQKLAVMTYTGTALPRCSTAVKIRGTATTLKNSTCHLTKTPKLFIPNSIFSDLGNSEKLVSRTI